jgi:3-hydroxy acid dehydrogenase/malonic semialdehyde reductase
LEAVLLEVRFKGDSEKAKSMYTRYKPLQAEDIAAVIHFVVTRPYHVNIEDLVVYSAAQAGPTILNKK